MKKQKYRIIGVITILILLVVSIIFMPKASALDLGDIFSNTCLNSTYKYGVYIDQDENDGNFQYVLRLEPRAAGSCGVDFDTLKLRITNVSGTGSSAVGKIISQNEAIVLGGDEVMVNYGNSSTVTVYLEEVVESTSQVEENTGIGGVIKEIYDVITSNIEVEFSVIEEVEYPGEVTFDNLATTEDKKGKISSNTDATFLAKFDAIASTATKVNPSDVKNVSTLKCSPKIKNDDGTLIDITGDNYYQNVNTFYTKEVTYGEKLQYTYNYAPGKTTSTTPENACKRTCEEAVKVEYGVPVASKAGLCFEYKVKVTSYVKCETETLVSPPSQPSGKYCNPAPKCVSQGGTLRDLPQAGPTEDFDNCINACDGGKYSEKCSLKCYKKVYGKDPTTKLSINYEDSTIKRLANTSSTYSLEQCLEDNKNYYGCYVYDGSQIKWYSQSYKTRDTYTYNLQDLGRWYIDKWKSGGYDLYNIGNSSGSICTPTSNNKCYVADTYGFFVRDYLNSGYCDDICTWRTDQCNGQYLNPGTAKADYTNNLEAYNDAVASCEAAASCSTSTAEFVIKATYNKKNGSVVKEVEEVFPTSPPETLKANTTNHLTFKTNTPIIDWSGCYKDSNQKNNYMTEWGFPGTWIHNKTGEISYTGNPGEGYYFESGKFCTPLNALSVNTDWWEYAETTGCYTTAPSPTTWNIIANTKHFGYFGWNFEISCFYALRNEICNPDVDGCCTKKIDECKAGNSSDECDSCTSGACGDDEDKESTVINYRIRSVDLKNLFPNSIENGGTRATGFNWTSDATIPVSKDPNYAINPVVLKSEIETKGTEGTYTDSELEYSFKLTPETLRKIRNDNKRNSYDAEYGTYSKRSDRSVNFYTSNFFNKFFDLGVDMEIKADKGQNNSSMIGGGY